MEHEAWAPLHLRYARGETLTDAESALLQAAYAEQDAIEHEELAANRAADLETLRKMRDEVLALRVSIANKQKELRRTSARVRRLGKALDPETREAIGLAFSA